MQVEPGSLDMTLGQSMHILLLECDLVGVVLANLSDYCTQARGKLSGAVDTDRKKLFLVNQRYSHHEEVDERLQFLKYIA